MAKEHPNAAFAREAFDAIARGDVDSPHEDVVFAVDAFFAGS